MRYCLLILLLAAGQSLIAQFPVTFDFNNCLQSPSGFIVRGGPSTACICAYEGDGVAFNGTSDFVEIDGLDSTYFNRDFTLSLLFSPDPSIINIQSLVSRADTCFDDNTLEIRYDGLDNSVTLQMFESIDLSITLTGDLDASLCWHELVFRREGNLFQLFIDGDLAEEQFIDGGLDVTTSQPVRLGTGPCVGSVTNRFAGVMDQFKLDTVAVPRFNFRKPPPAERIVTPDTVIFRGEIIDAETMVNCATAVQWSPADGISNTTDFNPIITTDTSRIYVARFTADRCSFNDTLRIVVLQEGDIECSELRLPSAFTPNGDGLNDDYGISNTFIADATGRFEIYARNGALVFSSTNLTDRWDGRWRGDNQLRPGTYIYKIEYTCQGEPFFKTGGLSVLR